MIGPQTTPSFRVIWIITVIQAAIVVTGTLFVTAAVKMAGYQSGLVPDSFFNSIALFVRHSGVILLLIPALWAFVSIVVSRTSTQAWAPLLMLLIGVAAILGGICFYFDLFFNPCII